ncbi:MAG: guanylate kinase, partial [Clostridiales Family XIII bacterium]|nr:guanylate kinase [Clostridiales Family XIII bacterium]
MKKGQLFVISGPSGTGKGTICKRLIAETDAALSISMTTRARRPGEREGESYFFVPEQVFRDSIGRGDFLEYAEVFGNFYGTPGPWVEERLAAGTDVILEIDIQGAMKVRRQATKGVFIFILPPSMSELRRRITGRGTESPEDIDTRLREALKELSYLEK